MKKKLIYLFLFITLISSKSLTSGLIHVAATEGNIEGSNGLKELLKESPLLINEPDEKEQLTPLHHAIRANQPPTINFLLVRGAEIYPAAPNQSTILHYAIRHCNHYAVKLIIKSDHARCSGKQQQGLCQSLKLWKKGNSETTLIDIQDDKGITPILQSLLYIKILCSSEAPDRHKQGILEGIAHLLITNEFKRANLNIKAFDGQTPLLLALAFDYIAALPLLIQYGAYVNEPNIPRKR